MLFTCLIFFAVLCDIGLVWAGSHRLPLQAVRGRANPYQSAHLAKRDSQIPLSSRIGSYHGSTTPTENTFFGWFQTVNITVGTPPQSFRALLDIQWTDLIVPSTRCVGNHDSDGYCKRASNLYDESRSSTSARLHETIWQVYATLIYRGLQVSDTVRIGDVAVEKQAFNSVTAVRPQWIAINDWDAVLGLEPHSPDSTDDGVNKINKTSVFQNMIDRKLLDRNVIGLKLAAHDGDEGELLIGDIDSSYEEDLVEMPVAKFSGEEDILGPWHVSAHHLTFGEDSFDLTGYNAVFTTAASFIVLPLEMGLAIAKKLGSNEVGLIPCEKRDSAPPLTFALGPHKTAFTVSGRQYIYKAVRDGKEGCWVPLGGDYEFPHAGPGGTGVIVLGAAFLGGFYSVFDADARTVSLATLRDARMK